MDLTNLEVEQSAFCQLAHPISGEMLETDDKKPIGFNVFGLDSTHYISTATAYAQEHSDALKANKLSIKEVSEREIDLTVSCVEPVLVMVDGEIIKDDKEKLKAFFRRFPWAFDQVKDFMGKRVNFIKGV